MIRGSVCIWFYCVKLSTSFSEFQTGFKRDKDIVLERHYFLLILFDWDLDLWHNTAIYEDVLVDLSLFMHSIKRILNTTKTEEQ